MSWLPGFVLLRPLWLVAVPMVVLVGLYFARRARGLAGWEKAIDPPMMAALQRLGRIVPGKSRRALWPVAVAAILSLALVGPASRDRDPPSFRNLDGIVIAVDLSRSIAEGGRLDDLKAGVQLLLQRAGTRPVALIVYAGEAYVASAFTTDPIALGSMVSILSGDIVPDPGSRLDRALALAARTLSQARIANGEVVVVTDGDQVTPTAFDAVERMRGEGAHVSALYVAPSRRPGDMPEPSPDELQKLAAAGDGYYATASEAYEVADAIGRRQASRLEEGDFAVLFYTDYGRYLLMLAIFPALALFRRSQ